MSKTKPKKQPLSKGWHHCEECGEEVWVDMTGQAFHRISCSKSNGIRYKADRGTT